MPFKDPQRRKEYLAAYQSKNAEALAEYRRKHYDPERGKDWRKRHPVETAIMRRKGKFKARYGITPEQYDQMVIDRNGKCDICKRIPNGKGSGAVLNVDHYVKNGIIIIRGLLCWQCNIAIGYLQHEILRLEAAIKYLEFE